MTITKEQICRRTAACIAPNRKSMGLSRLRTSAPLPVSSALPAPSRRDNLSWMSPRIPSKTQKKNTTDSIKNT